MYILFYLSQDNWPAKDLPKETLLIEKKKITDITFSF